MAFTETLSPFFDADDFAESVVIDGVSVSAIFDNAWAQAGIGVVGAATADPALTVPDASVPLEPEGKPVVVRGVVEHARAVFFQPGHALQRVTTAEFDHIGHTSALCVALRKVHHAV